MMLLAPKALKNIDEDNADLVDLQYEYSNSGEIPQCQFIWPQKQYIRISSDNIQVNDCKQPAS